MAGRGEWALRFPSGIFGTLTVPLMWAVALRLFGRGRSGRVAALAAALLTALSPLYVYYAQEARMYTQLTFLGLLAGYALLRATMDDTCTHLRWSQVRCGRWTKDQGSGTMERSSSMVNGLSSVRWWFLFVIASAALLYTHYFGVFLLLAYGVCFMIGWFVSLTQGAPRWRTLGVFALCCLSIVLLYLPWLPAMLSRYAVDRSYWQGALKINEALRHVAISFTTGAPETMLERDAVRLLPWFGVALVVAVRRAAGVAGAQRRGGAEEWRSRGGFGSCLLVYLSTRPPPRRPPPRLATPKFNPRYLMLVSPAYSADFGRRHRRAGGWAESARSANPAGNGRGTARTQHGSRSTHHAGRHPVGIPDRHLGHRPAQLVHRPGLHQGAVA